MPSYSPLQVNTITDLRILPVATDTVVVLVGVDSIGDNKGGFYRWNPTSTAEEDTRFMNVIRSTVTDTGRWVRVFQKVTVLPYGVLINNGGVKTLYGNTTTNTAGQATLIVTTDGTQGGAALFTEIWQTSGDATSNAGSANDAVIASRESLSGDLKTLVYRFVRGNTTTLGGTLTAVLNMVVSPLRAIPAGTVVTIMVVGV